MARIPRHDSRSSAIKLIAFCAFIAALYLAQAVLLPVAIAVLLAFALNPIVRRLQRPLRYRPLAVGVTIALTALLAAVLLTLAVGQARQFLGRSQDYRTALAEKLNSTRAGAVALRRALRDVQTVGEIPSTEQGKSPAPPSKAGPDTAAQDQSQGPAAPASPATDQPTNLFDVASRIVHFGATVLITGLLVAVILIYREDLRDRLVRILGVDSLPLTQQTLDEASQRVSRYLLAQAAMNALSGILIGAGMFIVGVPDAALLGIAAGTLRFVPYLGFFAAMSLGFLTALATSPSWTAPLIVLGIFGAVEAVISLGLEPWLYGKRSGLSLFGVVVAISFWGWLWGVPGLLVAVPLTVCVVLLARHFPALELLSVLLGDAPPLTTADRFHHRLLSQDPDGARAALSEKVPGSEAKAGGTDELWISSIRRAAMDYADGQLGEQDLYGYMQTARAILEPEARAGDPAATGGAVILFASSNPIDLLAAQIVRGSILRDVGAPVWVVEPPVMFAELVASPGAVGARALVVLSVARTSRRRARLLARTLRVRFPKSPVVLAALAGPRSDAPASTTRGIQYVRSLGELIETLGASHGPVAPVPMTSPAREGAEALALSNADLNHR